MKTLHTRFTLFHSFLPNFLSLWAPPKHTLLCGVSLLFMSRNCDPDLDPHRGENETLALLFSIALPFPLISLSFSHTEFWKVKMRVTGRGCISLFLVLLLTREVFFLSCYSCFLFNIKLWLERKREQMLAQRTHTNTPTVCRWNWGQHVKKRNPRQRVHFLHQRVPHSLSPLVGLDKS